MDDTLTPQIPLFRPPTTAPAKLLSVYPGADIEAVEVGHQIAVIVLAIVIAVRLFVLPEQVIRLHADVGSRKAALQQRPEVLKAVGMNLAVYVHNCMVNHLMRVVTGKPIIGEQRVGYSADPASTCLRTSA
jgi:hypothetical protein